MSALQQRLKKHISRIGDSFLVGGSTRVGVFSVLSAQQALSYMSQATLDSYSKPVHALLVAFDDSTAAGDTVTWDSLTLTVRSVVRKRLRNETVMKVLVVA